MSDWTPLAKNGAEDPAEVAAREARHQVLIELLGAYADHELPPETTSQIDAHLVGCARCRRELQVHTALRLRLEVEPPLAASSALRDRIGAAIATVPVPDAAPPRRWGATPRRWLWLAAALVFIAAAFGTIGLLSHDADAVHPRISSVRAAAVHVPLVDSVLADYRRVSGSDLPGRARDLEAVRSAVPFTVDALRAPELRLLAAWTTSLGGEPAAVLAYRWEDRVVLEYLVSEERFFQHPVIRAGVTDGRFLAITDGHQSVLAWPTTAAGAFLVGDVSPARLASLVAQPALARRAGRGAP